MLLYYLKTIRISCKNSSRVKEVSTLSKRVVTHISRISTWIHYSTNFTLDLYQKPVSESLVKLFANNTSLFSKNFYSGLSARQMDNIVRALLNWYVNEK